MSKTEAVTIHNFPSDLMREVEAYAAKHAGPAGNPSKQRAIVAIVREKLGLVTADEVTAPAIRRGDSAGGVRRGE